MDRLLRLGTSMVPLVGATLCRLPAIVPLAIDPLLVRRYRRRRDRAKRR